MAYAAEFVDVIGPEEPALGAYGVRPAGIVVVLALLVSLGGAWSATAGDRAAVRTSTPMRPAVVAQDGLSGGPDVLEQRALAALNDGRSGGPDVLEERNLGQDRWPQVCRYGCLGK